MLVAILFICPAMLLLDPIMQIFSKRTVAAEYLRDMLPTRSNVTVGRQDGFMKSGAAKKKRRASRKVDIPLGEAI